ncbi:MAG: hypothetical protein IOC54_02500 [Methylobacterium sp.]|nr:hypothetical protein [Methylobacterium sp.]MCA3641173.1 hypothetical protein [Methylobacterium sp.]MCA3650694.1 hypothetical protein [Methylobacterium sp.]
MARQSADTRRCRSAPPGHRPLARFGEELVRRLAHGGSSFSGVEPSGKPGAVQYDGSKTEKCRLPVDQKRASRRCWRNAGVKIGEGRVDRTVQLLVQTSSHAVFAGTGDLLVTGPTETHVNDLRVLLIDPM